MKKLTISKDLHLPLITVTSTLAILAKKGKGKSYSASVMAEEMLKQHQQIVVIDPTGAWWGLKSSADGKSEGFPVVVFGGDHQDIPLNEGAGEVIATAIVQQNFSAILDLSLLRKGAANRFMASFLETLYLLNRDALHLFIDEADAFAPQKTFNDEARTLGAMEDIVRRGRKKGIGCTMITQRPQILNKNVLTQCESLIALGLSHPKDINAVMEWVNVHADQDMADQMIDSLPSLPIGTAWFWSPAMDIFKKVGIRARETFDSGATPKPGEKIVQPKRLAKVDIKSLGESIEQIVEQKKAEDPRELKKKISELQAQLLKKDKSSGNGDYSELKKENSALRKSVANLTGQLTKLAEQLKKKFDRIRNELSIDIDITDVPVAHMIPEAASPKQKQTAKIIDSTISAAKTIVRSVQANSNIPGPERKILTALAQNQGPMTKNQLALRTGYAHNGGGFNNPLGKLRSGDLITGYDQIEITDSGLAALGDFEPLPTGIDLQQYWLNHLPGPEAKILGVLIEKFPETLSKEELAAASGYNASGGGFNNPLGKLRTLKLAEGYGAIKASENLFN